MLKAKLNKEIDFLYIRKIEILYSAKKKNTPTHG